MLATKDRPRAPQGKRHDLLDHDTAAAAFWGGLSLHDGGTQLDKFLYCLVNVALLAYSLFIDRRIYAVFGALGIAGYLGYLASDVFQDTIVFSFAASTATAS